jgi:ribosomal protein S18 acetylase RimI-like enzyme
LNIQYKTKTASAKQISLHLTECNANFNPPLDEKVNIQEYAKKIFKKSITFEAWANEILIGLVATYLNDNENHTAYITNVSVINKFIGKGIASRLMDNCIEYTKNNDFKEILLEVSKESIEAINLYKKFGFIYFNDKNNSLIMRLSFGNPD